MVCSYYELQGYFVRMNVPYCPTDQRKDASDIDIVAVHPREDMKCIACEVKGWHNERFTMGSWRAWPQLLNFTSLPATACCKRTHRQTGSSSMSSLSRQSVTGSAARLKPMPMNAMSSCSNGRGSSREMISFIKVRRNENARNQTDHVLRVLLNDTLRNPASDL